jgi:hypothetical protein
VNETKEIKIGKLYELIEGELPDTIMITERYYYTPMYDTGDAEGGWRVKCYYVDNPEQIHDGLERKILERYREVG